MTAPDTPTHQTEQRNSAAFGFIFVTVLLDLLSFSVIIPVLPKLVIQFQGGDTAGAAHIIGTFGTVWALMQFFCAPILGALSDRFGRRPVILLSNVGLGADFLFMALAPTLGWLFVGRVISGITSSVYPTAGAYIADVTPPDKRAHRFGLLGVAFGIGFIIGPALGGLVGSYNLRAPFWIAGGLSLANALYGYFVLPESLTPDKRATRFSWQRANPVGSLKLLRSHPELSGLAIVGVLYILAHLSLPTMFVLYADYRYGWNERAVGLVLALVGFCAMIVQGGLIGRIVRAFGERRALLGGLVSGAVAFVVYAWAPKGSLFLIGVPIYAFFGLVTPSTQALMSRRVQPHEQGQLQGANASLAGITGVIAPTLFAKLFTMGIHRPTPLPGLPYFAASSLVVVALGVAWGVTRDR
ncbi:MAG TPA: TCR/Tet family MFS transporter [Gemmatimonadaceae bacterium]|nr:TCR/Tet family MFS transporter [Gemmatimonadaceae bacterium]